MKKHLLLILALVLVAFSFGCNKTKPQKLNYGNKLQDGTYHPNGGGLPGEGRIGPTEEEAKYHGLHADHKDADHKDDKKDEGKKEEDKKPEE